jgi:aspartyl-tRNA(Asn)/glutamyl-tRNA(Gln) amidotransferase subunit C
VGISRAQVEKVALLARLELNETQLDTMTAQLAQIVNYVEMLGELDTDAIPPMAHPVDQRNVFAPDRVRPSLDRDDALLNAPAQDGQNYLVPPVLGE